MEKYSLVKLRSYLFHLVIGAAILIFGVSVLGSILAEMFQAYDVGSKYAYIFGIIACGLILVFGLLFVIKAFSFNAQVFGKISFEDKEEFFGELEEPTTLFYGRYLFVTRHYLFVYAKSFGSFVKLIKIDDLVGCFGKPYYAAKNELVQYDVILCDKNFKLYCCCVKGKKAEMMEEAWKSICALAPWVFHEDYVEFAAGLTKRSQKKAYLKMIEHRRSASDLTEDTIPDIMISAADVIKSFNERTQAQAIQEKTEKKEKKNRKERKEKGEHKKKKDRLKTVKKDIVSEDTIPLDRKPETGPHLEDTQKLPDMDQRDQ